MTTQNNQQPDMDEFKASIKREGENMLSELQHLRQKIDNRLYKNTGMTPRHREIVVSQIMELIATLIDQERREARIDEVKSLDPTELGINAVAEEVFDGWRDDHLKELKGKE